MVSRFLVVTLLVLSSFSRTRAEDWPQWLGSKQNAISSEKGLLDKWNAEPPLIWKTEGLGHAYAGVVIANGIICTMGDREEGKATVIALNAKNGKEIWATSIAEDRNPSPYTDSKSTPTIDGDRVYALNGIGHLVCLKTATGELIWEKSYKEDFDGRFNQHGYSESPLIDGDKLICSPGGPEAGIVALDKKTGKEIWRCAIEADPDEKEETYSHRVGAGYTSPIISHGAGVKQYIQLMAEGLVGIDAQTGKQLWLTYRGCSQIGSCTPIVHGDYVFLAQDGGSRSRTLLLKLERGAKGGVKAKEVYALEKLELNTSLGNAVLVGDYVYTSHNTNGNPQCLEFLTGKMMWQKQRGVGKGSASMLYADGNLYYHYENGITLLVAATPNKFQVKGKFQVQFQGFWSYTTISDGRLYVRRSNDLWCYNLKK